MSKSTPALVMAFAVLASAAYVYANCGSCDSGAKATSVAAASGCCGSKSCSSKECSSEECSAETCGSETCSSEKCSSETCSSTECKDAEGCPIAAAMERLPKLTYAVGEKKSCCPDEAAKVAKESGGHIHYCVAETEFDTEADAQMALIEATEKFVANFTEPHTCPTSGKVTLAGQPQCCSSTAAQTAGLMKEAMAKVKFTYLVGEQECGCPVEAGKLAKETNGQKLFVVGEAKTGCEKTARLNLARAKYKAAVEAMVKAESKDSSSES